MSKHVSLSTRHVDIGTLYVVALLREELGRRIATARVAAGLTQQQLAGQVGLRHSQDISRYERGKIEVPSHRIDLIAEATGRPRSYFTRDPSEVEPSLDGGQLEQLEQILEARLSAQAAELREAFAEQLRGLQAELGSLLEERLPQPSPPRGRRPAPGKRARKQAA